MNDTYTVPITPANEMRRAAGTAEAPRSCIDYGQDMAASARLAAIVQNSNDAIIGRTLDGTITSWNAGAERMLGYNAAEAIGQSVTFTLPPGGAPKLKANTERLLRGEPVAPYESQRVTKDGRTLDVLTSHSPVRDLAGNIIAASTILQDISALKGAERALAASEQRFSAIVQSSNDAIVSRAPDGTIQSWNAAAECMFGWSAQEAIGKPITIIVPPERSGEMRPLIRRVLAGEQVATFDSKHCRKDGARIDTSVSLSAMRNAAGAIEFISFFYRDITEYKKLQREAQSKAAFVRAILDDATESIAVVSAEGALVEINRAGLALFEARDREAAAAQRLGDFVLEQHRAAVADALARTVSGEQCQIEFEFMGLSGTRRWMESRTAPLSIPGNGATRALVVMRDITERKLSEARIDYLSHHDALTALPNRSLFQDRLERAIGHARRRGETLGVLLLNLDRFSKVNESLGASAGDELLIAFARHMQEQLRSVDTIARLAGNEFAVLVEGVAGAHEVMLVAEKLEQAYSTPFNVNGQEVFLSASIGIAVFPTGASDPRVLLQHAEAAMRQVKRDGGNGHALFEHRGTPGNSQHVDLERRLRHALANGELELHYQPKVNLATGAIVGAEALVRWRHPELGMVNPANFIPLAEETGLILPIGEWVLHNACRFARACQDSGTDLEIAVNLSPRQFRHKNLLGMVVDALDSSGLDAGCLELEITETAALSNPERAESVLRMLRGLGVRIALDDFGTGHSSLSHLRKLPLDALKIDRSFVRDIASNAQDQAIVAGVTSLARTLGMRITAEGIEDGVQLESVKRCGCDDYQGYHFSPPLPPAEFRALLALTQRPMPFKDRRPAQVAMTVEAV